MFDYKNVGDKTHLIYTLKDGDKVDEVTKNVLLHNNINGLTAFSIISEDGHERFVYDVSSMVSMHHYLNTHHEETEIVNFVRDIASIAHNVDNYLANSDDIVTGLDYVFINTYTKKVSLVLLPIIRENTRAIFGLFEQIADKLDNSNYSVGARLKSVLHSYENFSLEQLIVFIDSILQEVSGGDSQGDSGAVGENHEHLVVNNVDSVESSAVSANITTATATGSDDISSTQTQSQANTQPPTDTKPATLSTNTGPTEHTVSQMPVTESTREELQTASIGRSVLPTVNNALEPEKVSLFTLLMHYSKDNAIKRKAWKEWAKSQKSAQIVGGNAKPDKKANKKSAKPAVGSLDFATPSSRSSEPLNTPVSINIPKTPVDSVSEWQKTSNTTTNIEGEPTSQKPAESLSSNNGEHSVGQQHDSAKPAPAFGATQYLASPDENNGKTTLLAMSNDGIDNQLDNNTESKTTVFGKLISQRDGSEITITKPSFSIGRAPDCVDYIIINNTNISGVHAVIDSNIAEQKYYVTDTNSRNHVFIDDVQITPSEKTSITEGSIISFADEKYEFRTT